MTYDQDDAEYVVKAPRTPGAPPTWAGARDTLESARELAANLSRGRKWMRGQDCWIEQRSTGLRIEFAGLGS